jgi:hypothetical protein
MNTKFDNQKDRITLPIHPQKVEDIQPMDETYIFKVKLSLEHLLEERVQGILDMPRGRKQFEHMMFLIKTEIQNVKREAREQVMDLALNMFNVQRRGPRY